MEVRCLYLCNASNLVIKNKQATEEHGSILIVDNKHLSELVFICRYYLKNTREILAENYCFKELRKCLIETFLRKEDEVEFQSAYYQLIS